MTSNEISKIKSNVDIVECISEELKTEKKGNSYVALCPFHPDQEPSLFIHPLKQIFKCFACNTGGDVFKFYQLYKKITFIDAVIHVAKLKNISIKGLKLHSDKNNIVNQAIKKNLQINKDAAHFYFLQYKNQKNQIQNYIKERKISDNTLVSFLIGFAGDGNTLSNFLLKKGYSKMDILKSGLAKQNTSRNNEFYDFFRNRIIFPIQNDQNDFVGFSGRSLDGQDPKYLNSMENIVFDKSSCLFNLNNATAFATKENSIILVEGHFDVLAFETVNIHNSCATMGTSINELMLKKISSITKNIILFFDNDEAGIKTIIKIYKSMKNKNVNFYVTTDKECKDANEILIKKGEKALKQVLEKKVFFKEWFFDVLYNKYLAKETPKTAEFVHEAIELLVSNDSIANGVLAKEISKKTELNENLILKEIEKKSTAPQSSTTSIKEQKQFSTQETTTFGKTKFNKKLVERSELNILKIILISKNAAEYFENNLNFLISYAASTFSRYIVHYYQKFNEMNIDKFLNIIKEPVIKKMATQLLKQETSNFSNYANELEHYFKIIRKNKYAIELEKEIEKYKKSEENSVKSYNNIQKIVKKIKDA